MNKISDCKVLARRNFLKQSVALVALGVVGKNAIAAASSSTAVNLTSSSAATVSIENFSANGRSEGVVKVARVVKTEAEWRQQLSPLAFRVTREEGTEAPNSGQYAHNHAEGIYRCICCDTALFDSKSKYESGTGWPSFWQPISALNILKTTDRSLGMVREAISCRRCDAHLGHVFDDGPQPTGLRYCMNSVSLNFIPKG